MRVSSTTSNQVQNAEVHGAKHAEKTSASKDLKKKEAHSAPVAGSVNADISSKGKEFAKAKEIADSAPDVREDKIAALKARIAAGKYNVDADALAERMVDEHIKMSGAGVG